MTKRISSRLPMVQGEKLDLAKASLVNQIQGWNTEEERANQQRMDAQTRVHDEYEQNEDKKSKPDKGTSTLYLDKNKFKSSSSRPKSWISQHMSIGLLFFLLIVFFFLVITPVKDSSGNSLGFTRFQAILGSLTGKYVIS